MQAIKTKQEGVAKGRRGENENSGCMVRKGGTGRVCHL